mmetsp:Transcript_12281/g.33141  ORF Transcript_12281/g.33141 Transcript_12281/m.33141 type:complete len:208 (+) Transcript_12281:1047-1670(+)
MCYSADAVYELRARPVVKRCTPYRSCGRLRRGVFRKNKRAVFRSCPQWFEDLEQFRMPLDIVRPLTNGSRNTDLHVLDALLQNPVCARAVLALVGVLENHDAKVCIVLDGSAIRKPCARAHRRRTAAASASSSPTLRLVHACESTRAASPRSASSPACSRGRRYAVLQRSCGCESAVLALLESFRDTHSVPRYASGMRVESDCRILM